MNKSALTIGYGDYLRYSQLVQERCGLHFPLKKRADLEAGVRQAFAASTCANLEEYYRLLLDPQDGAVEMDRLVNALTISETHFFRNTGHFDALYNHVLPQIIARRRSMRTLRIWSAGCASGEEPYSIAMMLRELLPDVDQWSITILGTDVNTAALDRARKAVYSDWAFREQRSKQWRQRYFDPVSEAETGRTFKSKRYKLDRQVRQMVNFGYLNLASGHYPSYATNTTLMDLILCRNVTIYFTEPVTAAIIDRFYEALTENGWLIVGHSEHSLTTYRRFQARNFPNAILYQRTGQPTALPADWDWLAAHKASTPAPITVTPRACPTPGSDTAPLKPQPEPEQTDPLEQARNLLDKGDSEGARALLLPLAESQTDHAPFYTTLGQACANLGLWEQAERWCRQAIQIDKLALEAYYTLALVLQHQGQLDQAIDAMKKVIYINHKNALGHFGLADLYRNNGQWPQAQKSLDNARRLLEVHDAQDIIPGSGGITVGRLREAIIRQQQQWSIEVKTR